MYYNLEVNMNKYLSYIEPYSVPDGTSHLY